MESFMNVMCAKLTIKGKGKNKKERKKEIKKEINK
jgi:hypothetical protein